MAPAKRTPPKPTADKKAEADKAPPKKEEFPSNRPAKYRQYSDEEKAAVLALLDANKTNYKKTSEQAGVPFATLWEWNQGRNINQAVPKIRFEKGMALADITEEMARILAEVLPDKFEDADLRDSATAYGILIDKMNALRAAAQKAQSPDGDSVEMEQTDDHLIVKLRRLRKTRSGTDGAGDPGMAEAADPQGAAGGADVDAVRGPAAGDGVPQ